MVGQSLPFSCQVWFCAPAELLVYVGLHFCTLRGDVFNLVLGVLLPKSWLVLQWKEQLARKMAKTTLKCLDLLGSLDVSPCSEQDLPGWGDSTVKDNVWGAVSAETVPNQVQFSKETVISSHQERFWYPIAIGSYVNSKDTALVWKTDAVEIQSLIGRASDASKFHESTQKFVRLTKLSWRLSVHLSHAALSRFSRTVR